MSGSGVALLNPNPSKLRVTGCWLLAILLSVHIRCRANGRQLVAREDKWQALLLSRRICVPRMQLCMIVAIRMSGRTGN